LPKVLESGVVVSGFIKEGSEVPIANKNWCNFDQFVVFSRKMGYDTQPPPVLRLRHKPGAHGIERNVAHCVEQMAFIHYHRSKSPLPQMACRSQACFDIAGIAAM
jgi:hypothetical protein